MDIDFLITLWITLKLALLTTLILVLLGIPVAYGLAYTKFKAKPLVEALISMPMVLPPSVVGYYMLLVYSPRNAFGAWLAQTMDIRLAFSFPGILIASVLFSLPFMVQPLLSGLRSLPDSLSEASYTLGKSKTTTFFRVLLPNVKSSFITAIALTFAHCIGEFGIVLMVGGNIPGETRVASIAIYDEVQALNFALADQYAIILFGISFVLLAVIYSVNRKNDQWKIL
ncbi:Molybdenum transport system permease protein ModB [Arcticibacter svalbardensis MN12-7]|uniref:Molybdenum transport system permease n=1 Tax=Arcticibacter svalbardensis MN12-7 TaxID=1150600 RepID=R9GZ73_9SPHI|nr:molybdate ABC transporter permease subunit [Arcticibacter svalbardensis]EOR94264.1 Molybdenum transport system permease protein ModB [Arcticibacter svalbardensis MN12-7]